MIYSFWQIESEIKTFQYQWLSAILIVCRKILLMEAIFSGHAKRNEHTIDGNTRISYGGSKSSVEPEKGSEVVFDLLKDIGVNMLRVRW